MRVPSEPMIRVGMHEAKTQLSKLVAQAEAGEEVIIERRGKPVAKLVPLPRENRFGELRGKYKGQIWMADDFDELPDDIAEAFEMK